RPTSSGDTRKNPHGTVGPPQAPVSTSPPFVRSDPTQSARSAQTALNHKQHLGWAEIRHPFHPLRGQRFEVLKERRIGGVDTLVLRELERGTFSVAREWTDWADPSLYDLLAFPPQRLDADSLFELVASCLSGCFNKPLL